MSLDSELDKWICEYCTYENFPSAQKCTMCRGAKPLITEDIYKLRNDSEVHHSDASVAGKVDEKCGSWTCEICKHINSVNYKECIACNTARYNEAAIQEQFNSLTIGENEIVSVVAPNQRNQINQKWSCPVCTYENWPKAVKCIMCLTTRNKISPVSSVVSINSPERDVFTNSRNIEDGTSRSKK